jgi:hypothetical protein
MWGREFLKLKLMRGAPRAAEFALKCHRRMIIGIGFRSYRYTQDDVKDLKGFVASV